MADGLNRVMLLGNLCADPELRFTQGGQAVLHMRLATNESYLDKDKVRQERTDFHNVTVWGKRGEALAKFLTKGSGIFVEGSLRTSSYDNREGVKVYKTEINATNIILAGGKGGSPRHAEDPADSYDRTDAPGTAGADDFDPGTPFDAPPMPQSPRVGGVHPPVAPPARTGGGGYGPPAGRNPAAR